MGGGQRGRGWGRARGRLLAGTPRACVCRWRVSGRPPGQATRAGHQRLAARRGPRPLRQLCAGPACVSPCSPIPAGRTHGLGPGPGAPASRSAARSPPSPVRSHAASALRARAQERTAACASSGSPSGIPGARFAAAARSGHVSLSFLVPPGDVPATPTSGRGRPQPPALAHAEAERVTRVRLRAPHAGRCPSGDRLVSSAL